VPGAGRLAAQAGHRVATARRVTVALDQLAEGARGRFQWYRLPVNTDRSGYRSGPHGGALTPWTRGVSGNPLGGRVGLVALARRVREATGDGQELLQLFLTIMRGEPVRHSDGKMRYPKLEHRMWAASWLADRGWGLSKEFEITDEKSPESRRALIRAMTDDERARLRELLERAQARIESQAASAAPAALEPDARLPPMLDRPGPSG
jgi:hypothetical protein